MQSGSFEEAQFSYVLLCAALIEEEEDAFGQGCFLLVVRTVRSSDEPGPLDGDGGSGGVRLERAHKDFDRCHGTDSKAEIETKGNA